jgi:hypothetical protein
MILKCEYCKSHTAYSSGMKLECINCGASLKAKAYLTPIVKDILNPRDLALVYLVIEGALKHFG